MDFTGRLRFAEINTHDFPALIRSSKRRFSSGVHLVPRCCTAIRNATVFFLAVGPGRERANSMLSKRARLADRGRTALEQLCNRSGGHYRANSFALAACAAS